MQHVFGYEVLANGQTWHYRERTTVITGYSALKSWTEFWTRRETSRDYTIQQLEFPKNYMSVCVFHTFLGYSLTGTGNDDDNELEHGSIVWLALLHCLVGTSGKCCKWKEPTVVINESCMVTLIEDCSIWKWSSWPGMSMSLWGMGLEKCVLVSGPDWNVLKFIPTPWNWEKYQAVQSTTFKKLVMESLSAVRDSVVRVEELEVEVVLLRNPTVQLESGDVGE